MSKRKKPQRDISPWISQGIMDRGHTDADLAQAIMTILEGDIREGRGEFFGVLDNNEIPEERIFYNYFYHYEDNGDGTILITLTTLDEAEDNCFRMLDKIRQTRLPKVNDDANAGIPATVH